MSDDNNKDIKVSGIGGIFFYVNDRDAIIDWYSRHLGIKFESWNGCVFRWRQHDNPEAPGSTTYAIRQAKKPLPAERNQFVINYRVADLDGLMAKLREADIAVKLIEESEYGRFAHLNDPEGNQIELWQPPENEGSLE